MELIEFPSLLRNQPEGHSWTIRDLGVNVKVRSKCSVLAPSVFLSIFLGSPGLRMYGRHIGLRDGSRQEPAGIDGTRSPTVRITHSYCLTLVVEIVFFFLGRRRTTTHHYRSTF